MILSDGEIEQALDKGEIKIDPRPSEEQISPSSVDFLLHNELVEYKTPEELRAGILGGTWPSGDPRQKGIEVKLIVNPEVLKNFSQILGMLSKPVKCESDGSFILYPGGFVLGKTREIVTLGPKIAARVEGKSTLARLGISIHLTAPIIHAGWDGVLVLELKNAGPYPFRLVPGMTICQVVFERLGRLPKRPMRSQYKGQR